MIVRVITDGSKMERHDPVFVRKDGRVSSRKLKRHYIGTFVKFCEDVLEFPQTEALIEIV